MYHVIYYLLWHSKKKKTSMVARADYAASIIIFSHV